MDPSVEREIRTDLPIILEKSTELVLVHMLPVVSDLGVADERQIRWASDFEPLVDGSYRAREVEQQVPRRSLVGASQPGKGRAVDPGHSLCASAIYDARYDIGAIKAIRAAEPPFTATFERMFAPSPTERVPEDEHGITCSAIGAIAERNVNEGLG